MHLGSLTPAYGRDYKTAKAALADFSAGKDFRLHCAMGVTYANLESFEGRPDSDTVQLRFNQLAGTTSTTLGAARGRKLP